MNTPLTEKPVPSGGFVRGLAQAALIRAVRGRRGQGSTWGEAVLAEFDETVGAWASVRWAAGGLRVVWWERHRRRSERLRSAWRVAPGWVKLTTTALVCAVVPAVTMLGADRLLLSVVYVPTGSMSPSIEMSDHVLIDRIGFRLSGLDRGDLVLVDLRDLGIVVAGPTIRRIVGLPGDRVDCVDGRIRVNDIPLDQPRPDSVAVECSTVTVGSGEYYLLGDDLETSRDSREYGPVDAADVLGRALATVWPSVGALS